MVIGAAGAIVALALLLFLIWVAIYATTPRPAHPAGPPTGSPAMERKVLFATALIVLTGLALTIYAFLEPTRQAAAKERQESTTIHRGAENYASLCYSCHGYAGEGAAVPGTTPPRVTPQLNRQDLQKDPQADPDEFKKTYDLIYKTIQRGRPNTPMPAWGQTDGGTLNQEQVHELTMLIIRGNKSLEGDKTVWQNTEQIVRKNVAAGSPPPIAKPVVEDTSLAGNEPAQAGLRVWQGKGGCNGCHLIAGIGGGQTGPELSNIGNVAATRKPGTSAEAYIRESILQPGAFVVSGFQNIMPPYQGVLGDEEVNQLVQYYLTRKQ